MQVDLTKIVDEANSFSKASIEMATAVSDLGALKVFFGVAMMMFILLGIIAGYSLWNLNRKIVSISTASERVMSYFSILSNKTVGKEEAKSIVRESIEKIAALSKYWILRIRWENNLHKAEEVKRKVMMIIDNNAAEFSQLLSGFICVNKPLSTVVDLTDKQALVEMMLSYIYKDNAEFTPGQMSVDLDIYFRGLKINYQNIIDRI